MIEWSNMKQAIKCLNNLFSCSFILPFDFFTFFEKKIESVRQQQDAKCLRQKGASNNNPMRNSY